MKLQGLLALALGVSFSYVPAYADTTQTITESTQIVNPPRVVDSWMQPTGFRTTEVIDQAGESHLRQEPMIWERHERVVVPVVNQETTTTFTQKPAQTVKRSVSSSKSRSYKSSVSVKPRKRIASVRRSARIASAPRRKTIAYKAKENRDLTTTTQSMTIMQRHQQSVEHPVVIERRDPALDLF